MFRIFETDAGAIVELDERVTPPGLALELEVFLVCDHTFAAWMLSDDGRVLAFAPAGEA
jgi:hypothetical protein